MVCCNFKAVSEFVRRLLFFFLLFIAGNAFGSNDRRDLLAESEVKLFEENGKVGLKNDKGEVLIPATYEALGWSNGTFSIHENVTGYLLNGKWGLVNLENKKITKAEFLALLPAAAPMIKAIKKPTHLAYPKTGVINTKGDIVIPFAYDGLVINGLRAIVFQKGASGFKHGLIDLENRVIIPLQFRQIYALGSLRYAVESTENRTAIFSDDGGRLTDFVIDSIGSFKRDLAIFYHGAMKGVISRDGQIVVDAVYRDVVLDGTKVRGRKANKCLLLSGDNKTKAELHADSVSALSLNIYKLEINNKIQLLNKSLQPIDDQLYDQVSTFEDNKATFILNDRKGLLRENGSVIIPARYNELILDHHLIRANEKTQGRIHWWLLDSLGRKLTSKTYDHIGSFNGKFFPVLERKSWGAVDINGKEIIACAHDSIIESKDDLIVVKFKGGYGIINASESWLVTPQRHMLKILSPSRYLQYTPDNIFLKSIKGDIIYFTSNNIEVKSDHLLEFLSSGKIWRVNFDGIVTEQSAFDKGFEKIYPESEGLRPIKKDGRFGFVDSRLRLRIANRYEDVQGFNEGLAPVKILGKWGFINTNDNIAVQPSYDEVFAFKNGCALVRKDQLFGLVDKKGQLVLPLRYEKIAPLKGDRFLIQQSGLFGVADLSGRIILNPKFTSIQDVENGYLIVRQQGKYGVVTTEGISTIPLMYEAISYDRYHQQFLAVQQSAWEELPLK